MGAPGVEPDPDQGQAVPLRQDLVRQAGLLHAAPHPADHEALVPGLVVEQEVPVGPFRLDRKSWILCLIFLAIFFEIFYKIGLLFLQLLCYNYEMIVRSCFGQCITINREIE